MPDQLLWAPRAWVDGRWREHVLMQAGADGHWTDICDDTPAPEGAEVIAYRHSGSRSSRAVLALRAAGYAARNYSGSWHEWSRTDLPFAT